MSGDGHASTGIEGFDAILRGGFPRGRLFLIEGMPGSGKTTLAMQFLIDGASRGEPVLHVTMSETAEELRAAAVSHGWSLEGIHIRELVPSEIELRPDHQYTMFHPSEMELTDRTKSILSEVDRLKPTRVVFDSLSELRLLAGNPLRYRRQILGLKQFFAGRHCTVLLLDDLTATDRDLQIQSIAHGAVSLEQLSPEYGIERRRLRVVKLRGASFLGGYQDYVIRRGGLTVFPRLVAAEHRLVVPKGRLSSGVAELDKFLGGGIERGTSTLIVGAPGTGKSSLAARFVASAAERGQRGTMFTFDENRHVLLSRAAGLGIHLQEHIDRGLVEIQQVDPAELSPGEFAHAVRVASTEGERVMIVIDSLNGYVNAMPGEKYLALHLHEMLTYLGQLGVATILIGAHQGFVGGQMQGPVDASYLADAVLLLRYFEAAGEVRQAISIVKKRGGAHERTIREFSLEEGAIRVGHPLREFRGVLTGVPTYRGSDAPQTEETS
ncbi:MAG TPA: ATPase domain-containing protein [Candidatus Polarisedimenticolaceae bacterium]|nr:ATPase domain-containing protein [Candidatus Polarisedimenticolaceae bacterium]